ncbi:hypothetical protein WR25_27293 [Diploscapter pachys]|uniref:Uncharacterized protein n=1 Tax=Diploscapter pachys TaxID=2018661 RepID=A0A2A2M2H8_9BILA|nr:hypothetical protein WR25_27293 [Diploscapter pachys]
MDPRLRGDDEGRARIDDVVCDLIRSAAPVDDIARGDAALFGGGIAAHEAWPGRDRAFGERAVPDRMQVEPLRAVAAIGGGDVIAALVVLFARVQRLVQVADEVDQEDECLRPLLHRQALVLQDRDVARNLRRHAIAVLARLLQRKGLADVHVLKVPGVGIAEARLAVGSLQRLDAIGPGARPLDRRRGAFRRIELRRLREQPVDRAARLRRDIGISDLRDRLMPELPIGLGRRGEDERGQRGKGKADECHDLVGCGHRRAGAVFLQDARGVLRHRVESCGAAIAFDLRAIFQGEGLPAARRAAHLRPVALCPDHLEHDAIALDDACAPTLAMVGQPCLATTVFIHADLIGDRSGDQLRGQDVARLVTDRLRQRGRPDERVGDAPGACQLRLEQRPIVTHVALWERSTDRAAGRIPVSGRADLRIGDAERDQLGAGLCGTVLPALLQPGVQHVPFGFLCRRRVIEGTAQPAIVTRPERPAGDIGGQRRGRWRRLGGGEQSGGEQGEAADHDAMLATDHGRIVTITRRRRSRPRAHRPRWRGRGTCRGW